MKEDSEQTKQKIDKVCAKKSLGQNFLKSESALNKITEAGNISSEDFVLEIGPGTGALTEKILATGAQVLVIEKDSDMLPILEEKFSEQIKKGQITIKIGDVLEFDPQTIGRKYKLIANIPYYITGEIIRRFLSETTADTQPQQMVLLVQKEVADRIVTRDGKESLLSISINVYCQPRYVATVKAGSFVPAPKIDSAIVSFENISKGNFEDAEDEEYFFKIVRAGFSHKRKRLISNLKKEGGFKINEENFCATTDLDKNVRAEELGVEDWKKISTELKDSV